MKSKTETPTASLAVVGVDIGKEVFHLVGLGTDGTIAFRRKIRRLSLKDAFEQLPSCVVGMEACLSEHFVSRTLLSLSHEPRIIPAIYTKPFVKGQKNDLYEQPEVKGADGQPTLGLLPEWLSVAACSRGRDHAPQCIDLYPAGTARPLTTIDI